MKVLILGCSVGLAVAAMLTAMDDVEVNVLDPMRDCFFLRSREPQIEFQISQELSEPIYCGTDPPHPSHTYIAITEWLPQFLGDC